MDNLENLIERVTKRAPGLDANDNNRNRGLSWLVSLMLDSASLFNVIWGKHTTVAHDWAGTSMLRWSAGPQPPSA